MYVVGTLFRGEFWTIFAKARSYEEAQRFAALATSTRGERTKIQSQDEWDKASAGRERERREIAAEKARKSGRLVA